jgi:alginate O-acetyltransferase complex protein AlgI
MLFHSVPFALFLPILLVLDWLAHRMLPKATAWRVRRVLYLVASYVFYAGWQWEYCSLLLFSTVIDYWVGRALGGEDRPGRRKLLLTVSLVSNLGLLSLFKYYDFARGTLPGGALPDLDALLGIDLLLPVGISFFTFQTMSYTIDVYRRRIPVERDPLDFALYVAFFPQLVAGPIVRAREFLWQLSVPKSPRLGRVIAGFERFLMGLFKKTVIADNLTALTDPVFADPAAYGSSTNAFAVLCWGFVIYCDFSGYSDMAIGIARMLGFKFAENFRFPYLARSVGNFWQRWHISLSSWLRDYLYIPLGGSRHGLARTMAAVTVTMLLGGLWHGPSWNFVLWGAWWGIWIALGHLWRLVPGGNRLIPAPVAWFGTQLIAFLGWVPFRCADLERTQAMLGKLFSPELFTDLAAGRFVDLSAVAIGPANARFAMLALALALAAHVAAFVFGWDVVDVPARGRWGVRARRNWMRSGHPLVRGAVVALVFVLTLILGYVENAPFVYFQF